MLFPHPRSDLRAGHGQRLKYWIEAVRLDGRRTWIGPAMVVG
jgi:hypothetical protein